MRRLLGALALATFVLSAAPTSAAETHRAEVVIDTGSSVRHAVVTFSEDSISGLDALQRSGASPVVRDFGSIGMAVCQVDGVGHPADQTCLGTPNDPRYWSYYRSPAGSGKWTYSSAGASSTRVHDGDIEGWHFSTGGPPAWNVTPPATVTVPPASSGNGPGSPSAAPGAGAQHGARTDRNSPSTTNATSGPTPSVAAKTESNAAARPPADAVNPRTAVTSPDSGSPWGLVIAGIVVAALVAAAFLLRARRARPSG